ncbi:MAG TPA: cytochrome c [Candidatus Dormibacteraeota bacterium]|nr:cytochrome c [Candidatus Dormibacteraeota bacterium]
MRPMELGSRSRTFLAGFAATIPLLLLGVGVTALADAGNAASSATTGTALPGDPTKGSQLFQSSGCVACHGANLEGGVGAKLNPIAKLSGVTGPALDAAYLETTIHSGRPGQPDGFSANMPSNPQLSDQDLKDIASFIIQQNQTVAPGLSPSDLARSDVFWVATGILAMVLVSWLLATYNMRWIDKRAKARTSRD